jgi:predicted polyphosphate/ATP-dependent NAD kinase
MMEASDIKDELRQVDLRIEDLKKAIELGEAVERLHENEDFITLVIDGYMEEEAERIFGVLTTPTALKRDQLENMMDKLGSIRDFKAFIGKCLQDADMAPDALAEEEKYRKEVTASGSIEE